MEDVADAVITQAGALSVDEPVADRTTSQEPVAPAAIIGQHRHARGVQRHQSGLAELGRMQCQDSLVKIDIVHRQCQGFADAQTCDAEQAKQAVVGVVDQLILGR